MNSLLRKIFIVIQDRIASGVPALRWIDQDMGQLEIYTGDRVPVAFPAVLLEINDVAYSDGAEGMQMCVASLEVRLALCAYSPSAHIHSLSQKQKALEYFDLEHQINRALHGFCESGLFSPLMRTRAATEKRDDNIRVRNISYSFSFTDNTALMLPAASVPRPEITINNE